MIVSPYLCGRLGFLQVLVFPFQPCQQSLLNVLVDPYGDHIQTCQRQSAALPTHEWIVHRLSLLFRSVGHRVKTHKVTPVVGNDRDDIEVKDYVIYPRGEDDRLPPRTLMMDVTMAHDRFGRSTQRTNGALTHRVSSTGAPQPDGALKNAASKKIRHYRQLYADKPDPVIFLSVSANTSGRIYDDFVCLLFLHAHREASILAGELPEESDQFRFLRAARLANLKVTVGLILAKASAMRVTIPIDLSTRPFIPLPRFFNSRRPAPLLNPSLVIFCLSVTWCALIFEKLYQDSQCIIALA